MADMRGKIQEFYKLEQLAEQDTPIHRLHPGAKLLTTFVFIITVVSFDRLQFRGLIPFLFYPAFFMGISGTPWGLALKRVALALPFVVFAGLTNILFDRVPVLQLGGLVLTAGVVSFAAILLRTFLTVLALVMMISTTPFSQLTAELRRVHVPDIFVTLFEMTYRYIGVLLEETSSMHTAYILRHRGSAKLEMKHMGSFVGSLLLRSIDRASRVYAAMKCRGYGRAAALQRKQPWRAADWIYTLLFCSACILCRLVDVVTLIGGIFA